jgi:hypothetical protein
MTEAADELRLGYLDDGSIAGWVSQAPANLKRDLLIEDGFSGVQRMSYRALRLGHIDQFGCPGNTSGSLATFDDGST